jgi:hypothetical protein
MSIQPRLDLALPMLNRSRIYLVQDPPSEKVCHSTRQTDCRFTSSSSKAENEAGDLSTSDLRNPLVQEARDAD